jgi:hypothetical protein
MSEVLKAISWEAPEHRHIDNSSDWFWVLGIIAICGAVAAFLFGNFLFALVILLGAGVVSLRAIKPPKVVSFMVGNRGVRLGDKLLPYSNLESYRVDEDDPFGPTLLLKTKQIHMPLLTMPLPEEYVDEIEDLLRDRLPEEDLEEPLAHKLLELLGF